MWGIRPRVKVWSCEEIRKACWEDRCPDHGHFGAIGVLDVAYGEAHPVKQGTRTSGPMLSNVHEVVRLSVELTELNPFQAVPDVISLILM